MSDEREAESGSRIENEPAIDSGGGFVRLRLDIAYDGTEFAGWAVQAGQRTVAGVIEPKTNKPATGDRKSVV